MNYVNNYIDERKESLKTKPLKKYIERNKPVDYIFEQREPEHYRSKIVYGRVVLPKTTRYYMYVSGCEIGHAGILSSDKSLCDVKIYPLYRGQGYSYPLVSYVIKQENPKSLFVKSSGPLKDQDLVKLYSKFGFKLKKHPKHKFFMVRENYHE